MVTVAPVRSETDRRWLADLWRAEWGGTVVVTRGVAHRLADAAGLIAWDAGRPLGAATFRPGAGGAECELLSLNAVEPRRGVGSALLAAVEDAARRRGCRRILVVTTNDNLDALRFYQRRGYRIAAFHRGAVDRARRLKPGIPEVGLYGIPVREELELDKALCGPPGTGAPHPTAPPPASRPGPTGRQEVRALERCVFCAICQGGAPASVVCQDADCVALLDVHQPNPYKVLVVPRRHVEALWDLDDRLAAAVFRTAARVARAIRDQADCPGLNVVQSSGAVAGQDVFHLHLHLLPRLPGDAVVLRWPDSPADRGTLDRYAAELAARLEV